jgi:hypothetical protein
MLAGMVMFSPFAAVLAQEQGRNWAEERFKMADRNRDGKVGPDEVQNFPRLAKALNEGGDTNGDGFLTFEESKAFDAGQHQGQQSQPSSPASGAKSSTESEWRVTGFVRQGQHQEASLERTGLMPRFVREGDRLPGGVLVVGVSYDERSVTLIQGTETLVVRAENYMAPPPPPPKAIGMQQQQWNKGGQQGRWPNPPSKPTAMRDGSGRWHVVMPDGRTTDMQADAQSHGGVRKAIEHVQGRIATVNNPERVEYYKQELEALRRMEAAGMR